jgi:hypothetical protein
MDAAMNKLATSFGAPVADDNNTITAGPRGPALLQDIWFLKKLAHFDREVSFLNLGSGQRSLNILGRVLCPSIRFE